MKKFLMGAFVATLLPVAGFFLYNGLGHSLIMSVTTSSANAAARVMPARADNGELGTFWLSGGVETEVGLYRSFGICLISHGSVRKNPTEWHLANGGWILNSQWQASIFEAGGYDAVRYQPATAMKLERIRC